MTVIMLFIVENLWKTSKKGVPPGVLILINELRSGKLVEKWLLIVENSLKMMGCLGVGSANYYTPVQNFLGFLQNFFNSHFFPRFSFLIFIFNPTYNFHFSFLVPHNFHFHFQFKPLHTSLAGVIIYTSKGDRPQAIVPFHYWRESQKKAFDSPPKAMV